MQLTSKHTGTVYKAELRVEGLSAWPQLFLLTGEGAIALGWTTALDFELTGATDQEVRELARAGYVFSSAEGLS